METADERKIVKTYDELISLFSKGMKSLEELYAHTVEREQLINVCMSLLDKQDIRYQIIPNIQNAISMIQKDTKHINGFTQLKVLYELEIQSWTLFESYLKQKKSRDMIETEKLKILKIIGNEKILLPRDDKEMRLLKELTQKDVTEMLNIFAGRSQNQSQ